MTYYLRIGDYEILKYIRLIYKTIKKVMSLIVDPYFQLHFSRQFYNRGGRMWLALFGLALIATQSLSQDGKE